VPDFQTKDTSDVPQPMEDVLHQPRSAKIACADSQDACELLIAELKARRVRLRKLLHLLWLEADSAAARRVPVQHRARCCHARIKRTA
jgi:hypothetical protein